MAAPLRPPRGPRRRWLTSTDHKVIGIQYWSLALVAVLFGTALSLLMRLQLAYPTHTWTFLGKLVPRGIAGGVFAPEFYLAMVTLHGTLMVFFVLTTAPLGGFGNYFLPLEIGARRTAFPRLGRFSFWLTLAAFAALVASFFAAGGGPLGGWTAYPPLSALGAVAGPGQGGGMDLWVAAIALFCVASVAGSVNLVVTTLALRCRGMSLFRMPLPVWGWFSTGVIVVLAFPVLLAAGILLLLDRNLGTSFFVPGGLVVAGQPVDHRGGSPLLWQHLFWFFGHPEVYIAILPGMGIVSQVLADFARKPVFGYRTMVVSIAAIAALGFLVWGHHMFVSGMSPYGAIAFSVLTLSIGVPSAVKTFNWLGTVWGGSLRYHPAMLFALGFVSVFVTGGLTGIFLGQTSLDLYLHDTYFVVGHFHMIMGVAALFAIFAATYYWFPKMFGRMLDARLGTLHFVLTFVGVSLVFVPMLAQGIMGHPRRYYDSTGYGYLAAAQPLHELVTWAALATAAAQGLFLANLVWAWARGPVAGTNPWEATTLEWTTESPPPPENFAAEPVVHRGAYAYSVPGAERDFVVQTDPSDALAAEGGSG